MSATGSGLCKNPISEVGENQFGKCEAFQFEISITNWFSSFNPENCINFLMNLWIWKITDFNKWNMSEERIYAHVLMRHYIEQEESTNFKNIHLNSLFFYFQVCGGQYWKAEQTYWEKLPNGRKSRMFFCFFCFGHKKNLPASCSPWTAAAKYVGSKILRFL